MNQSNYQIISFSNLNAKGYNVDYSSIDFGQAPFNGLIAQLEPSQNSHIHNHFEVECFLFLSGNGLVNINDEKVMVGPGIGIRVPAFMNHIIENTSQTEPLKFISIYWGDKLTDLPKLNEEQSSNTTLIFSPPTTPNGDLHLGHLSGPYLAADIYKRYLSYSGLDAKHVTGRDDHQTYIVKKSRQNNVTPDDIADLYSQQIRETLSACGISIDYYIEPNRTKTYAQFIQTIFQKLYDEGYIYAKNELAPFHAKTHNYLHEAFIHGLCPHCQKPCDGNACEECGRPNACTDLINAYDDITKDNPQHRDCERLYFNLSRFTQELMNYIKSTSMSAHALALSLSMLENGLPDICVSHPSEWGIQTPISGFQDQIIYVWFELALGYLWGAMQVSPKHLNDNEKMEWFYNHNSNRVVHFYGFDNTYYHTLLFPAIYFALGIKPPTAHIVNELLDLNGSKFSTSRGHAIWARDLLQTVPLDYLRWFLSEVRPEGCRKDFTLTEFTASINQFFAGNLTTWITKLAAILDEKFNGVFPESGAWTHEHRQFLQAILNHRQTLLENYTIEVFSPSNIVLTLKSLCTISLRFLHAQQILFESQPISAYARTAMALSTFALKIFALFAKPIIPDTANALLGFMNITNETLLTDTSFSSSIKSNLSKLPTFYPYHEKELMNNREAIA